jgi:putative nucleotidyltransferase with HDIG domain
MYDREHAFSLLCENTQSDSLRRHCLAVETALRFYARKLGEDEALWATVGVLHDFDYEKHPDEHPLWGVAFLRENGWPEVIIRAVASHADRAGVSRESALEKHLYAVDELTGFVSAVAYVRPSKSVHEVEVKSVLKKLKTPAFAAAVNREEIHEGAGLIGLSLEEHIQNVIDALRTNAVELGLEGTVG